MKICVISNLYPPIARGGAERIAELQVRGLIDSGHETFVVSTKPEGSLEETIENDVRIFRFRPANIFYYLDDYKYNIIFRFFWNIIDVFNVFSALTVWRILKVEQPELVITHNLKGLGMLVPLIIKRFKIRHIHVLHDIQLVNPSGLLIYGKENSFVQNGWPTKIYQFFLKNYFSQVDKVVFPSKWLKEFYEQYGFFSQAQKEIIRNPLGVAEPLAETKTTKQNAFLYLGQLEHHKGVDWLLNFWQEKKVEAKLLVAGTGSIDLSSWRNAQNIEILGFVQRDEISKLFKQVDYLIFPSLCYENLPTVIIESFQNATPVIVSNIGGSAELIVNEHNGYLFQPQSRDELLSILNRIKLQPVENFMSMSSESLKTVTNFDMAYYINELLT